MSTLLPENFETVAPSEADALLARESSRRLATHKLGRKLGRKLVERSNLLNHRGERYLVLLRTQGLARTLLGSASRFLSLGGRCRNSERHHFVVPVHWPVASHSSEGRSGRAPAFLPSIVDIRYDK